MSQSMTNILVVGVGGQGVMTASEILSQAAIVDGKDVKKTEIAGMAQRGGVVSSHVRFGEKVLSPNIMQGEADIIVAFEAAEALRWTSHLRPGGVMMVNTLRLVPPVVSSGFFDYPEDPVAEIKAKGIEYYDFDAGSMAHKLGDIRLVNTIMLGAISELIPLPAEVLKECVVARFRAKKPQMVVMNEQAFEAGQSIYRERSAA
jgi:indolepyruvate ferredoxin oxidoreductase, beta subunit